MNKFFSGILNDYPAHVNAAKVAEMYEIMHARDESLEITSMNVFINLGETLNEYQLLAEKLDHTSTDDIEFYDKVIHCQVKMAVLMGIVIKYLYPIIEQLEKIVDDGIEMKPIE